VRPVVLGFAAERFGAGLVPRLPFVEAALAGLAGRAIGSEAPFAASRNSAKLSSMHCA
jgi:hypothetical protein